MAQGPATLGTCTVSHGAQGANGALVIGTLDDGSRFIANTPTDTGLWDAMQREDFVGRRGRVSHDGQRNVFVPG